jgi:hypothetical protein
VVAGLTISKAFAADSGSAQTDWHHQTPAGLAQVKNDKRAKSRWPAKSLFRFSERLLNHGLHSVEKLNGLSQGLNAMDVNTAISV